MSGRAYYNENDAYAAQWLRNLVAAGLVAPGDIDERDIRDVRPVDLRGYAQCHFFAGIGIWSAALRDAAWPDRRPVWTGSCPCQPFSAAGKRGGTADDRHLWPYWSWLIRQCRPVAILGEQVASKDGLCWYDIVSTDLENAGYRCGAVDLCSAGIAVEYQETESYEWLQWAIRTCPNPILAEELRDFARWSGGSLGVGAPHIRQRLWFMAYPDGGDAGTERIQRGGQHGLVAQDGGAVRMGDANAARPQGRCEHRDGTYQRLAGAAGVARGPVNGFWRDADWIPCTDGKSRPVEPGTFPLVDGYPNRMGILRAAGNAINKEAAAAFIRAAKDLIPCG